MCLLTTRVEQRPVPPSGEAASLPRPTTPTRCYVAYFWFASIQLLTSFGIPAQADGAGATPT